MSKDDERKQRLAEQLRANLRRRKAQAKARGATDTARADKAGTARNDQGAVPEDAEGK